MIEHPEIVEAVRRALEEDIGAGDATTQACVPEARSASGFFLAREALIVAGIELLPLIYRLRGGVDDLRRDRVQLTERRESVEMRVDGD